MKILSENDKVGDEYYCPVCKIIMKPNMFSIEYETKGFGIYGRTMSGWFPYYQCKKCDYEAASKEQIQYVDGLQKELDDANNNDPSDSCFRCDKLFSKDDPCFQDKLTEDLGFRFHKNCYDKWYKTLSETKEQNDRFHIVLQKIKKGISRK
jgi:hypothetical protein